MQSHPTVFHIGYCVSNKELLNIQPTLLHSRILYDHNSCKKYVVENE